MGLPGFFLRAILSTLGLLASLLILAGQGYWALVGYRFAGSRFRAPRVRAAALMLLAVLYLALVFLMNQALKFLTYFDQVVPQALLDIQPAAVECSQVVGVLRFHHSFEVVFLNGEAVLIRGLQFGDGA